jgi:hypothetical protein
MDSYYIVCVQTRDESDPDCVGASDISDALARDFDPKHVVEVVVARLASKPLASKEQVIDVAMQNVE